MRDINKFLGCLIGGAAGDALGFPVEFLSSSQINSIYGEQGIIEYDKKNGVAQISDDTQMTLFTANGLLSGTTRALTRGIRGEYSGYIANCYKDWLKTQTEDYPLHDEYNYSWLVHVPELFSRRSPGHTCLSAIEQGANGTIDRPINNSKGCGGIMRVAPIGLYFVDKSFDQDEIDMIGAEVAAITHGHELGYIPAAALVHIISFLSSHLELSVKDAVIDSMSALDRLFPNTVHLGELKRLVKKAITLSENEINDVASIAMLGEGWVAEETLAISIYCALKYSNDFEKAIIAAVNHGGDSDSTGSITGNILGVYLGLEKIPSKYIEDLELKELIFEITEDLYSDCKIREYSSYRDPKWERKYIDNTYNYSD